MKLTKFVIENYQQFIKQEIVFTQGLNFVFGHNEAGKSTVSRALLDVLFESPERNNKATKAMQSWHNSSKASLDLEFNQGEKSYRLIKDWRSKSSELIITDNSKQSVIKGNAEVEAILKKLLPFYSREIYEDTAFISADSVMEIHDDVTGFKNALQNAVVGGSSVAVNSILKDLEKQIKDINTGMDRYSAKPGKQKQLINNIAALENDLMQAKASLGKLINAQIDLQAIKSELGTKLEFIKSNEEIITKNEKAQSLKEDKENANNKFEQIQQEIESRGELQEKINSVNKSIEQLPQLDWHELEKDVLKISGLNDVISSIKVDTSGEAFNKNRKLSIKLQQIALPVIAVLIFSVILSFALQSFIPILVAVVLTAIVVFEKFSTRNELANPAANPYLQNLQTEQDELAKKYSGYSLNKLEKLLKDFADLTSEKEKYVYQLEILNKGKSLDTLEKERSLALKAELLAKNELEELDIKHLQISAQEYTKLSRELKDAKTGVIDLEAKKNELEFLIKHTEIDNEKVMQLEEQLDFLKAEQAKVQQRLKVLELTQEGLEQAISATANDASALVEAEIAKYLPLITANRYNKARLNSDLSLAVYSESKQDWCACEVATTELSRGTVDQIYLITRLAFIKLLTGQKKLPIILDDPLLTFDAVRKAEVLKLLAEFAKDYQIIFFTFDSSISAQTILG